MAQVKRHRSLAWAGLVAFAALSPLSATAERAPLGPAKDPAASTWAKTDQTEVRLLAATETVGDEGVLRLGLHFRMKKGWKIYWRSPGDAGFPPRLDWSGSQNLKAATVSWPVPKRFSILGFETLGYKNEVVLPILATLAEKGKPLKLRASVDYLTCNDICIPYKATLALGLPTGPTAPSPFAHLINRFSVRVPGDGSRSGLAFEKVEVASAKDGPVISVRARSSVPFAKPDLFVEGPPELQFSRPRVQLSENAHVARLEVPVVGVEDLKGGLIGTRLTLTLADGARAAERSLDVTRIGPASRASVAAGEASAESSLAVILVLAVIGGLILNLMPCVLPVLSIKVLKVIGHGGREQGMVRLSFIASAAGILFAFLALAAALAGLKQAGLAVGWGIQFQHPWFLATLAMVMTLFACNLWGFFDIRLPARFAAWGDRASHIHGLGGHFFSGVFATLLATPCSAPFLGAAVAFALARGTGEIFAVFTALAVGLALPFLVIAAAPGLATRLPRPGPWMGKLRRILGFALAATVVWLLSVLAAQVGLTATLAGGAILAGLAGVLYLRSRLDRRFAMPVRAGAVVLAVLAVALPAASERASETLQGPKKAALEGLWTDFDEGAIAGLVDQGKTVFVDVTADWCITCQVNKALVIAKGQVLKRLSGPDVVAMQADWTLPSDTISRYLARHGRYGVPFNAVYGPGSPEGIVLPELLTTRAVLAALDRATGSTKVSKISKR